MAKQDGRVLCSGLAGMARQTCGCLGSIHGLRRGQCKVAVVKPATMSGTFVAQAFEANV